MSSDSVGDVSRHPIQRGPPRSIVGKWQAALDVHHARPRRLVAGDRRRPRIRRLQRRPRLRARFRQRQESLEYEAASPVTSSPAVAKGKVVVATADGQVICFGSRQTPTVDSVSQREYSSHFHSSSMQREADERS
ncbi:MAG: hypothetical protein E6H51_12220 [Betaproteobacteria bacterium]|nr:MAG: hypothetical protein DMG22_18820 [Acidobacteriota bacterium]TMH72209.1 MAG: hypothetical protein E6H51_12220 [Betaproteobacteria bacterium]